MKISIVTAAFNSAGTIADAMESVLAQTYPDIEYVLVDGASKDATMDVAKKLEPEFRGRMKWVSEPDKGIYDAMNKGIKMASGDVVGTLNSDDMLASSDAVENIAEALLSSGAECAYGRLNLVDWNDTAKILRESNSGQYRAGTFRKGWHPAHPTFYAYKRNFEKFGYYRTDFKIAADFELMMRFLEKHKLPSAFVDKLIVNQRAGGASTKFSGHIKGNLEILKAFKVNGLRAPLLCLPRKILPKLANRLKNKLARK